jgi:hypothetical protein
MEVDLVGDRIESSAVRRKEDPGENGKRSFAGVSALGQMGRRESSVSLKVDAYGPRKAVTG